jgi:hypothetical protein
VRENDSGRLLDWVWMKIRAAIVVIKDWKERAFLRAELIEEGIRTFAVETMDDAKEWLSDPRVLPIIVIYDTQFQDNPPQDTEHLRKYISDVPILIITSRFEACPNSGFKHIIRRPVTIGDIVNRVKEILKGI